MCLSSRCSRGFPCERSDQAGTVVEVAKAVAKAVAVKVAVRVAVKVAVIVEEVTEVESM